MRQAAALGSVKILVTSLSLWFSLLELLSDKKISWLFRVTDSKLVNIQNIRNDHSFGKRKTYLFWNILLFQNIPNERTFRSFLVLVTTNLDLLHLVSSVEGIRSCACASSMDKNLIIRHRLQHVRLLVKQLGLCELSWSEMQISY